MSPALQLRLGIAAAVLIFGGLGLWYLHHDGYEEGKTEVQAEWIADREKLAQEHAAQLEARDTEIKLAQEQHDEDQAAIGRLHDDVDGLRLHLPACSRTASVSGDPHGTAGVFSARVDEGFGRLQERAASLLARCDQLNIDAIRTNRVQ